MLRFGFLLCAAYTYGDDSFRDLRPDAVDVPMMRFHSDVNETLGVLASPGSKFDLNNLTNPLWRLTSALKG
jgi:hypothetical protein